MVITKSVLKDCYERSNPSRFNGLTVIDYSYYPKYIVYHLPCKKRANSKNPNTHRLLFLERHYTTDTHKAYYHANAGSRYGICYNPIINPVYTTGNSVICLKDNDFVFLEANTHCDLTWCVKKPTKY